MIDRPAWYPDEYPWPPVRATPSRQPFTPGESLTLYEAARLISGRHPYPLLPDGVNTLGPFWGLIAGGSTGEDRRRHRPQRGKAAFEALRQKVESGGIPAEMCRFAQPGTISDGGIDWLNVKVATADVVHLCEEQGWRCGLLRGAEADSRKVKGGIREDALAGEKGMQQAIRQAAEKLWPDGVPVGLLKKNRNDKIYELLSKEGLGKPHERTIRRAIRGK